MTDTECASTSCSSAPAKAIGTEEEVTVAFRQALFELQQRISLFLALRIEAFDRLVAESQIRTIGNNPGDAK